MVFSTTMSVKARVGFGLVAILPLLAPYKLLIKTVWADIPGLTWLFFIIISLGAISVTVLLFLVAVYGINRRVEFDDISRTIRVTESHLMQRQRKFNYRFLEVAQLEVVCHDWSDGPSTYEIRLTTNTGMSFTFGDFSSRVDAETTLSSLRAMIEKLR